MEKNSLDIHSSKADEPRKPAKPMRIPTKITPQLAEIAGAFAADGSMQPAHICLWGNITEDRDYYDHTLRPLFKQVFDVEVRPHPKESNSVYGFYVCTPAIIEFFHDFLGFPYGSKTYTVTTPQKVLESENPEVWAAFVRGYADGDGNLYFMRRKGSYPLVQKLLHTYPRVSISSVSEEMIETLSVLTERLGIKHTTHKKKARKPNESPKHVLCVRGEKRLHRWMSVVGFNNPVQRTRHQIFRNFGFVPPHTDLKQRKAILLEELSPLSFYPGPVAQPGLEL